ncbi:hypothetical protein NC652_021404 [Populus alba x Populus x berolinensis]|nr:hypothetical protein NC652_021404 [Populus alba x Populus x berolinensis]
MYAWRQISISHFTILYSNSPVLSEQNHKDVLIVVDSQDYPELIESLEGDQDDQQFRRKLAWEAFNIVLPMILQFQNGCGNKLWGGSFTVHLEFKSSLRYGENPHQNAAFYVDKSISEVNTGGIAALIISNSCFQRLYCPLHLVTPA